ncbi:MAG: septal ring lytic transglycosylase RlpA family protein [Rhizobiaceae bacterium]|nr:septal ring lytic transglycosylase RlpA family protein [Rhizobiaceae bacterium]
MPYQTRLRHASVIAVITASAALLAACTSSDTTVRSAVAKKPTKEYFSEAEYGVKASPLVSTDRTRLKRGGGRDQVGKPYQIKGKWYYPKDVNSYSKLGAASWYGDAFHGRLTANGEIYDMTHLTAAHPTLPLPSYARVTNTKNGASVIVRVNDRGPYANNRIIDMSRRAAEMLDYVHSGTASVKVEYIGRAPLDGNDDAFLMASYRPGNKAPDPSDGLPTGVMIAMNGTTPSGAAAAPFPGVLANAQPEPPLPIITTASMDGFDTGAPAALQLALPELGPIVTNRPDEGTVTVAALSLSYASGDDRANAPIAAAFGTANGAWKSGAAADSDVDYVMVGSFHDEAEARRLEKALSAYGRTEMHSTVDETGVRWFALDLYPDGRAAPDAMLEAAWSLGAEDAMTVRF